MKTKAKKAWVKALLGATSDSAADLGCAANGCDAAKPVTAPVRKKPKRGKGVGCADVLGGRTEDDAEFCADFIAHGAATQRVAKEPIVTKTIGGKKFNFRGNEPYIEPRLYGSDSDSLLSPEQDRKKKQLQQKVLDEIAKLEKKEQKAAQPPGKLKQFFQSLITEPTKQPKAAGIRNTAMKRKADLEFGGWVSQYGGPAYECGFAIITTSDGMIEDNYRERLEEEGKEFTGWTDEDSDRITKAAMQLEDNAMKYLRKHFSGARADGHDSRDDLIGAVWLVLDGSEKSKNAAQLLLSAGGSSSESLRDWGLHEGIYDGIADDILEHSVDVEINFFGIEPDEEEMLERYIETGEIPVDPNSEPPAPKRRRSRGATINPVKDFGRGKDPEVKVAKWSDDIWVREVDDEVWARWQVGARAQRMDGWTFDDVVAEMKKTHPTTVDPDVRNPQTRKRLELPVMLYGGDARITNLRGAATNTTTRRSRAAAKESSMQTRPVPRTASIRVTPAMLREIARTGQFVYKGWLYTADAEKTQTSTPNRPDAEDAAPFIDDTYDTRSSDKPPKMDDLDFAKNKKVTFKAPGSDVAAPFVEDTPAEYASEKPHPVKAARHHVRRGLSTIR